MPVGFARPVQVQLDGGDSELNEFVALAKLHPPRCIASYAVFPDPTPRFSWREDFPDFVISFSLRCPCGTTSLNLIGIPDEELGLNGQIATRCPSCETESLLFDIQQHGYDSEFGHGTGYAPVIGTPEKFCCGECGAGQFETHPWFTYQFESLDEFDDIPRESISNYFDTFGIDLLCSKCRHWCGIASYECA